MNSIKWFRFVCGMLLSLMLLSVLPVFVLADTTTTPGETVTPLQATTPVVSLDVTASSTHVDVVSGSTATITMTLNYTNTNEGAGGKAFDLIITPPSNWTDNVTNSTAQTISNITLTPGTPSILTLSIVPPTTPLPDAGDYPATFEVSSGDINTTVDLTVTVTAQYGMTFVPTGTTPVYSTQATAGKVAIFSVTLTNTGSAAITDVALSAQTPASWEVDFPETSISSLAVGATQTFDVKIIPASGALAGDYLITLSAHGVEVSATDMSVRVTVITSAVWAWIGVVIIVIVVVALIYLFVRFSRR